METKSNPATITIEIRCLDCGERIPSAERSAEAGHAPREPRCYDCGSKRHFARHAH